MKYLITISVADEKGYVVSDTISSEKRSIKFLKELVKEFHKNNSILNLVTGRGIITIIDLEKNSICTIEGEYLKPYKKIVFYKISNKLSL